MNNPPCAATNVFFPKLSILSLSQITVPSAARDSANLIPLPDAFRGNPGGLVWAVVLVGFATAGFVQWTKELTRWRHNFHRGVVHDWVTRRRGSVPEDVINAIRPPDPEKKGSSESPVRKAIDQLELLSGGDALDSDARDSLPAYSLSAEELCGQLASAAEVTVAAPDRFPELFSVFAGGTSSLTAAEFARYVTTCRTRHQELAQNAPNTIYKKPPETPFNPETSATEQRYAELRAQFMVQAQRSLDNLQIRIGEQWRKRLTLASVGFSFLFGWIIVGLLFAANPAATTSLTEGLFTVFVITLAGALAAPMAHDLMRAIRSFRR